MPDDNTTSQLINNEHPPAPSKLVSTQCANQRLLKRMVLNFVWISRIDYCISLFWSSTCDKMIRAPFILKTLVWENLSIGVVKHENRKCCPFNSSFSHSIEQISNLFTLPIDYSLRIFSNVSFIYSYFIQRKIVSCKFRTRFESLKLSNPSIVWWCHDLFTFYSMSSIFYLLLELDSFSNVSR